MIVTVHSLVSCCSGLMKCITHAREAYDGGPHSKSGHGTAELRKRQRKPIENRPQALLDARDIQRTDLSDFLENRLREQLGQERIERAKARGLAPHQVCRPALWPREIPSIAKNDNCGCVSTRVTSHCEGMMSSQRGKKEFGDALGSEQQCTATGNTCSNCEVCTRSACHVLSPHVGTQLMSL